MWLDKKINMNDFSENEEQKLKGINSDRFEDKVTDYYDEKHYNLYCNLNCETPRFHVDIIHKRMIDYCKYVQAYDHRGGEIYSSNKINKLEMFMKELIRPKVASSNNSLYWLIGEILDE